MFEHLQLMSIKTTFEKILEFLTKKYKQANALSGGVLEIIRMTFMRFGEERGAEASASLAYYSFFSIFPMLLVFIAVGSFFVDPVIVRAQLLNLLRGVLPGVEGVIIENINQVVELRGAVTVFALVSLVWSATNVFNVLAKNINRAFPNASVPDFLKARQLGFFMFMGLGLLMILSLAVSTLSGWIPTSKIFVNGQTLDETFLWKIGALLVPIVINLLMFWAMYQWVPTVEVSTGASVVGGLVAGLAWELLNNGFTFYLSSGLSQYRLIYGSVGTVVALLFWIYLTATICLLGAHLTAAIQAREMEKSEHQAAV